MKVNNELERVILLSYFLTIVFVSTEYFDATSKLRFSLFSPFVFRNQILITRENVKTLESDVIFMFACSIVVSFVSRYISF